MEPEVVGRVKAAWASLAEVDQLGRLQVVVGERPALCPPDAVGVLVIDDTVTVSVPRPDLKAVLREAFGDLQPSEAASPAALLDRLPSVSDVLGPAALFYAAGPVPPVPGMATVERRTARDLGDLVASVPREDLDESGVGALGGHVFVVFSPEGSPVAVCGYRRWPAEVAHLCVLTHPSHRRAGFGEAVARAAIRDALAENLLPQWRTRVIPSQHLARKLGLLELGAQLSFRLQP